MAVTYDRTNSAGPVKAHRGMGVGVIMNEVDLDLAGAGAAVAPVATDIIKVLRIPKGSVVLAAGGYCTRIPTGTATYDYDQVFAMTASKGLNISGTWVVCHGGAVAATAALGILAPATITAGTCDMKLTDDAADDAYITVVLSTLTTMTTLGKFMYYAVIADLNCVEPTITGY